MKNSEEKKKRNTITVREIDLDTVSDRENTDREDMIRENTTRQNTTRQDPEDGAGSTTRTKRGKSRFISRKIFSVDLDERQDRPGRNTELVILTWLFAGTFLLLCGYLIWFNTARYHAIVSNVYNTKQDASSSRVIRGDIVTENREMLAMTQVDYTGNEIRSYPYGRLFSHVIGYASNGKAGLEAAANKQMLSSHASLMNQLKSAGSNEKVRGDTIMVTLNPRLQEAAYYALGDYRGAVVVIEPDSGKILAMVSKPDFDPNTISADWESLLENQDTSPLLNRALQGLYPPGSIFKILTALAYLRENNTQYEDMHYDCTGYLTEDDVTIHCYNGYVHGAETLKSAFANSCNTAFASIGLDLNNNDFRRLAESFLFNRSLPIDLPHSQSKFSLNRDSSKGEQMTTAIGQGDTLVTPMHMAMVASAVANAGTMMKPYLVQSVISEDGSMVSETKPEIYDELMTTQEAQIIGSFMRETVASGTGNSLNWESYSVAGKTGSAEYETSWGTGTHSWFIGYSNVNDLDLAIAVIAEDGGTGSETAVPIAHQIFNAYYYGM